MPAYLSPIGNDQQADANGAPVSGALINTYLAGTTTPVVTYTDAAGLVPQANPVVCNAAGFPASPIFLPAGVAVKMVFTTSVASGSVAYRPAVDNIQGVNDPSFATTVSEWTAYSGAPSFISATSFSVTGDQTNTFQVGRRTKTTNTGGTVYSTITASSFGASITTVTVLNDSGALDAGLSAVNYALLAALNPSSPVKKSLVRLNTANGLGSTSTAIRRFSNVVTNQGSDITYADSATLGGTFTINAAGVYAMSYSDMFNGITNFGISLNSAQLTTGAISITAADRLAIGSTGGADFALTLSTSLYLTAGSVIRAHVSPGTVTGAAPATVQFTIARVG